MSFKGWNGQDMFCFEQLIKGANKNNLDAAERRIKLERSTRAEQAENGVYDAMKNP